MLLLFLDTETTGVNFLEDQIIEIAGLVIELDKNTLSLKSISSFESLVGLRKQSSLDPKITRITGITDLELSTAPSLWEAQEKWANWLESFQDVLAVVGHSVDFDKNFLKKESWFLPENIKFIDTLGLAKIFLPQFSAVNLEFLQDKLNLLPKTTEAQKSLAHRALFDAELCLLLFENILTQIAHLNLTQSFLRVLLTYFLPLELSFYPKSLRAKPKLEILPANLDASETIYLDFAGKPIEAGLQKQIDSLEPYNCLQYLDQLFEQSLPREFSEVLLQLYLIYEWKILNPKLNLKLHGQGKLGFGFAEIILNLLTTDKLGTQNANLENHHNPETELPVQLQTNQIGYILSPFENILVQIKNIAEDYFDLGKIANYIDIYLSLKLHTQKIDQTVLLLEKWVSAYEFLLISLNPFWLNNEFKYYQYLLNHQTKTVSKNFTNLCDLTYELKKAKFQNTDDIGSALAVKIQKYIQVLEIHEKKDYNFRFISNALSISTSRINFDLSSHFENLFINIPDLIVETYLNPASFAELLEMIDLAQVFEAKAVQVRYLAEGLPDLDNNILPEMKEEKLQQSEQIQLKEFVDQSLEKVKASQNSLIILGGQNSTLKDFQKICLEDLESKQYLILGESGSLTKVSSKIEKGFTGLIVTKVGDIYFLLRQKNIPRFEEIWIVNQPYLWIHPYWNKMATNRANKEEFLNKIKSFYLEYQLHQIAVLAKTKVKFLKGYKL